MHSVIANALQWASEQSEFADPRDYRTGYRGLLLLFERFVRTDEFDTVVAGATAVYGWMPRVFSGLKRDRWEASKETLNNLRSSRDRLWVQGIIDDTKHSDQDIMLFINNSPVGTSKFLHFLNPYVFPIWDRNIARCFGKKWPHQYMNTTAYLTYFNDFWNGINEKPNYPTSFLNFAGEDITQVRRLELLLFLFGQSMGGKDKVD